jgi:hypothetical protein
VKIRDRVDVAESCNGVRRGIFYIFYISFRLATGFLHQADTVKTGFVRLVVHIIIYRCCPGDFSVSTADVSRNIIILKIITVHGAGDRNNITRVFKNSQRPRKPGSSGVVESHRNSSIKKKKKL